MKTGNMQKTTIKSPEEYMAKANFLALNYCPKIYPCKKCGDPVITGYCCRWCGDNSPNTTIKEDMEFENG